MDIRELLIYFVCLHVCVIEDASGRDERGQARSECYLMNIFQPGASCLVLVCLSSSLCSIL